ncbi:hypothetical protein KFE25_004659 [Diacronema lutheri]|uniref:Uncharacterized protein n=1 Tax=Diacronema lutheri TaxID=2081491 RepID=A0A8J6CCP2_DIALT|nr:hypothetical protein KFE25_004659 [Diacronema lutheri]
MHNDLDPMRSLRTDYSKSALKANFSRVELKQMKKEEKRLMREAVFQQAEQLLGASIGGKVSMREAQSAIREHNVLRGRKLVRISSAITGATASLALWWLLIAASTPLRTDHRSLAIVLSLPLWATVLYIVGLAMRYKQATGREAHAHYYRPYPLLQLPPLRAFVAMLTLHLGYRVAVLLDGGALSARLHPPAPLDAAAAAASAPSALDVCLAALIPSALSLCVVLPVLVALPMHAANEKLGGFSEVKQFQFYLGIAAIYAVCIGTLSTVRWLARATDSRSLEPQGR